MAEFNHSLTFQQIQPLLETALSVRSASIHLDGQRAYRLFNGFLEGYPDLVVDIFADTLVIFDYSENISSPSFIREVANWYRQKLDMIENVLVKIRNAESISDRKGRLIYGNDIALKITEENVHYAVDLTLNQDTSFYLDTRNLRRWLKEFASGRSILNTFAYTGSLGVAATAGGARKVIQTDRNRKFLNLAKVSYTLNGFPVEKKRFLAGDFFKVISGLKQNGELFDIVILDPPYFSQSDTGKVDLQNESQRLINKVRPLVANQGYLVVVNNALFLPGSDFYAMLETLCKDGYLAIDRIIPVPMDITGTEISRITSYPCDPGPFNHPTKIAVLRVLRKDKAR